MESPMVQAEKIVAFVMWPVKVNAWHRFLIRFMEWIGSTGYLPVHAFLRGSIMPQSEGDERELVSQMHDYMPSGNWVLTRWRCLK